MLSKRDVEMRECEMDEERSPIAAARDRAGPWCLVMRGDEKVNEG